MDWATIAAIATAVAAVIGIWGTLKGQKIFRILPHYFKIIFHVFILPSPKGVDYTQLRKFLAVGNWKEADFETSKVILRAAGRSYEKHLKAIDIEKFSYEDLRTIDSLWIFYSRGLFGFSIQKRIYQALGGTEDFNDEIWKKFCERVGWRKQAWVQEQEYWMSYEELDFSLNAPKGHLPWAGWGGGDWTGGYGHKFISHPAL
ncbi:MAG: GUN4 domain-containing protein [Pleurocapsa sp. MO_226.B13]|nr:GUN4 domain-containing protein [Pleurocapsa sp. MO_226.B13]